MVHSSFALLALKVGTRAGSRLRLVKSPVTLTEAATDRIKELLEKRQKVRVALQSALTCGLNFRSEC